MKTLCRVVYLRIRVGIRVMRNQGKFWQRCKVLTCNYADRNELVKRSI